MSEIKFKSGTHLPENTSNIRDSDIVMINNNMDGNNESESGLGSIYKGTKIVGTTKADELLLTEPITVIGTNVGNISNNDTLAKGTSIEEILKMMLQKEVGLTTKNPTKTVLISPDSKQEVGTTVPVNLYASLNDGKIKSSNMEMWNFEEDAGCAVGIIEWKINNNVISSPYSLTVQNGNNTFNVKIPYTGIKKTLQNNLGKDQVVVIADDILTDSKTIIGSYKYFIGECDLINSENDITSELVRGLSKSDFITTSAISYTVTHNSQKGFIVACPKSQELEYIKDDASVFEGGFTKFETKVNDAGGNPVDYDVFYCNNSSANAAIYKYFKFK